MTPEEVTRTLADLFGNALQTQDDVWQVEDGNSRLLVMLSDDHTWLKAIAPIAPANEAEPFLEQLLEANFEVTQEIHYALHQGVLWAVFNHRLESLMAEDLQAAAQRIMLLQQQGLADPFNSLIEGRMRQIIQASKRQGQSLEETMQALDRLYSEGVMGDLDYGETARSEVLSAWRRQLERLWTEVEP